MNHYTKGFFLTLEGPDGCGKTTQSRLLKNALITHGFQVVHTREPGGTSFAEHLRRIILNPKYKIVPAAELLLYEASRAQHTEEIIRPALNKGAVVLCERYCDATVAYQGYGRGLDIRMIEQLNKVASSNLRPHLTLYLDIDAKTGLKRAKKLNGGGDRLERESASFHLRVRNGYLRIAKRELRRIKVIPAGGSVEDVRRKIWDAVKRNLGK